MFYIEIAITWVQIFHFQLQISQVLPSFHHSSIIPSWLVLKIIDILVLINHWSFRSILINYAPKQFHSAFSRSLNSPVLAVSPFIVVARHFHLVARCCFSIALCSGCRAGSRIWVRQLHLQVGHIIGVREMYMKIAIQMW